MDRPRYEPTEAEIREHCRRIQAGWTKRTERQRREWAIRRARIPVVDAPELGGDGAYEEMEPFFNR